jgi:hypothetical protein
MAKTDKKNGGDLGFEAELFKAADKLRGNMEPSDYKHVVLGLIFLKYISDAFDEKHKQLMAEDASAAEDRDEYAADNVFWVPKEARWSNLQANAKQPTIGTLIDDAMRVIEKDNESLKGVLPKDYARPALNKIMLGELIDLISKIDLMAGGEHRSKDVLGRVYEYFLGRFADASENAANHERETLRLAGVRPIHCFLYATLPSIIPQLLSYTLYRWENNIRAAAVLGVVGAGGLGQMLSFHMGLFQMNETSSILIVMILLVVLVDSLSYLTRRILMR